MIPSGASVSSPICNSREMLLDRLTVNGYSPPLFASMTGVSDSAASKSIYA